MCVCLRGCVCVGARVYVFVAACALSGRCVCPQRKSHQALHFTEQEGTCGAFHVFAWTRDSLVPHLSTHCPQLCSDPWAILGYH